MIAEGSGEAPLSGAGLTGTRVVASARSAGACGGVLTLADAGGGVPRTRGVPWALSGVARGGVLITNGAGTGSMARGVTGAPSGVTGGVPSIAGCFGGIGPIRGSGGFGGLTTISADRPTAARSGTLGAGAGGD
jgi:hypothetical protein